MSQSVMQNQKNGGKKKGCCLQGQCHCEDLCVCFSLQVTDMQDIIIVHVGGGGVDPWLMLLLLLLGVQESLEEKMAKAYDKFHIKLQRIQMLFAEPGGTGLVQ